MPKLKYSEEQIDHLILGIYMDIINVSKLPKELYLATAEDLLDGVYEGNGTPLKAVDFGNQASDRLTEIGTTL